VCVCTRVCGCVCVCVLMCVRAHITYLIGTGYKPSDQTVRCTHTDNAHTNTLHTHAHTDTLTSNSFAGSGGKRSAGFSEATNSPGPQISRKFTVHSMYKESKYTPNSISSNMQELPKVLAYRKRPGAPVSFHTRYTQVSADKCTS